MKTEESPRPRQTPDGASCGEAAPRSGGANAYQAQEILTASPARLVAKLYEAAITALRQAIQAIETGEIEQRWRANKRAIDIIEHLLLTLDLDRGGEIAGDLKRLYTFMMRQLATVDLRNDPAPARAVIALLEPLHRSWCELDRRLLSNGAGPAEREAQASPDAAAPSYGRDKKTHESAPSGRVFSTA